MEKDFPVETYEEERDEPAFCIKADDRMRKKLAVFLEYARKYNFDFPDTFEEDIGKLYAAVDREFDSR